MYKSLAFVYDLIYKNKNYEKESHTIKDILSKFEVKKGSKFLDACCGTGGIYKKFNNRTFKEFCR